MSDDRDIVVFLTDDDPKRVDFASVSESGALLTHRYVPDDDTKAIKRTYAPHAWEEVKEVLES